MKEALTKKNFATIKHRKPLSIIEVLPWKVAGKSWPDAAAFLCFRLLVFRYDLYFSSVFFGNPLLSMLKKIKKPRILKRDFDPN